jgi:hypothetical protein
MRCTIVELCTTRAELLLDKCMLELYMYAQSGALVVQSSMYTSRAELAAYNVYLYAASW